MHGRLRATHPAVEPQRLALGQVGAPTGELHLDGQHRGAEQRDGERPEQQPAAVQSDPSGQMSASV